MTVTARLQIVKEDVKEDVCVKVFYGACGIRDRATQKFVPSFGKRSCEGLDRFLICVFFFFLHAEMA